MKKLITQLTIKSNVKSYVHQLKLLNNFFCGQQYMHNKCLNAGVHGKKMILSDSKNMRFIFIPGKFENDEMR